MTAITDPDPHRDRTEDDDIVPIGWLNQTSNYRTGKLSPELFKKLESLCHDLWQPFAAAGFHECELCQFHPPQFKDNLFIPGTGRIYMAPVGILHYIAAHHYLPPDEFLKAVEICPPTRSMDYKKALLANGGRQLLKPGP